MIVATAAAAVVVVVVVGGGGGGGVGPSSGCTNRRRRRSCSQGWEWSRSISAEMVGVQGPSRPRRGPGAGPWWGLKGGNAPFLKTNFAHFEAKTWPLLERKVLNYHITWL